MKKYVVYIFKSSVGFEIDADIVLDDKLTWDFHKYIDDGRRETKVVASFVIQNCYGYVLKLDDGK